MRRLLAAVLLFACLASSEASGVAVQLTRIGASFTGPALLPAVQDLRSELLYLPEGERRQAVELALQAVSGSPESVGRLAARLGDPAQAETLARLAVRAWSAARYDTELARQLKYIRRESWPRQELREARAERRSGRFRDRDSAVRQLRRVIDVWDKRGDAGLDAAVGAWLSAYAQGPAAFDIPAPKRRSRVTAYFFDIDGTIFNDLPTNIILFRKSDGRELAISNDDLIEVEEKIGNSDETVTAGGETFKASDYEFRDGVEGSFREFKDQEGKNNFLTAVKRAVESGADPSTWQGPSWDAFVRALSDPETAQQVAIVTARGHRPQSYVEAFRYLQEKGFIKYVPLVGNMHSVDGASDRPAAKMEVIKTLLDEIQAAPFGENAPRIVDQDGTGFEVLHSAGFSDDDWRNIVGVAKGLRAAVRADPGRWDKVKVLLFYIGTKHPTRRPGVYVLTSKGKLRRALPRERGESGLPDAPKPIELLHRPAARPYDKPDLGRELSNGRLAYGAELTSANPISAATLADQPALSALFVDATRAERGALSAIVKAVQHAAAFVIGRFHTAADPYLKPKLDEGLLGAVLERAESLKDTLRFLSRLYTPPLGERSVGPSDVTGYLAFSEHFTGRNNAMFLGGVSIATAKGASAIESIVKAKERGLKFVEVDAPSIARSLGVAEDSRALREALEKVEAAARAAGLPLFGRAESRADAAALHARGYRHVVLTSDVGAVDAAFDAFDDRPADAALEAARGTGIGEWLKAGKLGHLGFLTTPDVELAKRMADRSHGVWIDAEDGQFTLEKIRAIIAALPAGTPVLVRSAEYDDPLIADYLAAGASGIIAPQVRSALQARAFVETVRAGKADAVAVVMIENRRALQASEAIAAVPGIDALFIGPYDLSLSLQASSDSVPFQAAIARIEAAARAAKVPLGGLSRSRTQSYRMHAKGYGLLATVYDQAALADRFKKALSR